MARQSALDTPARSANRPARSRAPWWLLPLGLFLFFLGFYPATASGHTITIDGDYYYRAAVSLALRGTFALPSVNPADLGRFALLSPDGALYGKFAPLQSVAEALFYLLARATLSGYLSGHPLDVALRVWVPVATTTTISAGIVALTAIAVLALGYPRRVALAAALILGLATLVWPYGRSEFSEPLQTILLLGAFLALRADRPAGSAAMAATSGLLLGLLVLTKAIFVVVLPVFGLALLWRLRKAPRGEILRQALVFGIAASVGVAAFGLLNVARTGNALDFGYGEPFDTPLLLGLYGWTLSPGKGVFLYMPVLAAALVAAPAFARRHGFEAGLIAATTAVLLFFYARFWAWSGDWAWGTRFALPLLPLWILPVGTALVEWRAVGRTVLALTVAISFVIQFLGVAVDPMRYLGYYYGQVAPLYGEPAGYSWSVESASEIHFAPELSPILMHARIFVATVSDAPARAVSPRPSFVQPPPLARALGIERWLPEPSGALLGLDPWPLRAPPGHDGWLALACLGAIAAPGAGLAASSLRERERAVLR